MKMRILFFLVSMVPGSLIAFAQSPEDTIRAVMQAIKIIHQQENLRFQAMEENNLPLLDTLLSDDLTYTHTDGKTKTKGEFLERLRSGELRYKSIEVVQMKTRVYGNTAVVTGWARVQVKVKGQDTAFQIRFIEVYVLKDGRWQMVAWQSTRLPQQ